MYVSLYIVDSGIVRGLEEFKFYISDYLQLYHPSLQSWATPIFFIKMDVIPVISTILSGTMTLFKQILLITSLQKSINF